MQRHGAQRTWEINHVCQNVIAWCHCLVTWSGCWLTVFGSITVKILYKRYVSASCHLHGPTNTIRSPVRSEVLSREGADFSSSSVNTINTVIIAHWNVNLSWIQRNQATCFFYALCKLKINCGEPQVNWCRWVQHEDQLNHSTDHGAQRPDDIPRESIWGRNAPLMSAA